MLELEKYNKIIAANWKMNGSTSFVQKFIKKINTAEIEEKDCIIVCPPSTYINLFQKFRFFLGSQDCSIFHEGAYTGEVSVSMLKDLKSQFCIVGHSERRIYFKETDELINKKILNCLKEKITPILCIGETLEEKEKNITKEKLIYQLKNSIPNDLGNKNILIAYEPIWAIGTGLTPTNDEINQIFNFLKNEIKPIKNFKLLYGGSVNVKNYQNIMNLNNVDGVLIGGSSLKIDDFYQIISKKI